MSEFAQKPRIDFAELFEQIVRNFRAKRGSELPECYGEFMVQTLIGPRLQEFDEIFDLRLQIDCLWHEGTQYIDVLENPADRFALTAKAIAEIF